MVVALRRRVVLQPSREKGLHRLVDGTADAGDQLNARRRENVLRPAADTAADEKVHAVLLQETAERRVTAALRVDQPVRSHRALLYLIERKPARMSEVLKYFTVFLSRYRNYSVSHDPLHPFPESPIALDDKGAAPASGHSAAPFAGDLVVAAVDKDTLARAESLGHLGVRGIDDALQSAARYLHTAGRRLLV